jgi:hypothetical protein
MTARPRTQAIAAHSSAPLGARRSDKLRRQLFVERLFFLALIALLVVVVVRQGRALRAYQITVNGAPVATVGDARTANRLLRELQGNNREARFRQTVAVRRVNPRAWIMGEKRARSVLAARVNVIVPGAVILVNGRVAAALASKEQAEQVLSRLRRTYGGSDQQSRFDQSVRVETTDVSRAKIVSPDQAFRALTSGEFGLTVVTTEERTEIETIPHPRSVQVVPDLPKGQRRVIAQGADGEKTVRYRVIRANGRVVKRETVAETVARPPKPERVMVGAGA